MTGPIAYLGWGVREANPASCPQVGSTGSQERGQPTSLGGSGKGAEWLSGVVLPVGHMAVAWWLGLRPEEDSEEQHDEKEKDGAAHSQGHNHLCTEREREDVRFTL